MTRVNCGPFNDVPTLLCCYGRLVLQAATSMKLDVPSCFNEAVGDHPLNEGRYFRAHGSRVHAKCLRASRLT